MFNQNIHQKFQTLTCCPICGAEYNQHWKVVNHIRKSKDVNHFTFLDQQENEYIEIYENIESKDKFHEELYKANNIFCGTSFTHSVDILKKKYNSSEIEQLRRKRISKTLSNVPKTKEHNEKVSNAVKKAWESGKFDTEEVIKARQKGYDNRKSYIGKNNPMYGKCCPHGKSNYREDLKMFVRSTWEANFCRICLLLDREFIYEPKRFWLKINGKDCTYCPDFYLPKYDCYYELKGHAHSKKDWKCWCKNCTKNKLCIPMLRKQGIKIHVITNREYKRLKNAFKNRIENWER